MSTRVSVPDVQSTDVVDGALSTLSVPAKFLYALIDATHSLAFQHLQGGKDLQGNEHHTCQSCFRGSLNQNELKHTSTCFVGAAINAAWAMRAAVAKAEAEAATERRDVKVIRLGLGEVVSNWGTHNGVPSIFLEPVRGATGFVGDKLQDGREPQITIDSISDGGVIVEIHSCAGVNVVIEDLWSAINDFQDKHPEDLKCGDCTLIHGKNVCTMNCGPVVPASEREMAARRLEEVSRQPVRCGVYYEADDAFCNKLIDRIDQFVAQPSVHASTECDGKNPLLEEVRPVEESEESWQALAALLRPTASWDHGDVASERVVDPQAIPGPRRVVCGARWLFGREDRSTTCDKPVGHDEDPRSDHFNAAQGFSWPTKAAIAAEMGLAR